MKRTDWKSLVISTGFLLFVLIPNVRAAPIIKQNYLDWIISAYKERLGHDATDMLDGDGHYDNSTVPENYFGNYEFFEQQAFFYKALGNVPGNNPIYPYNHPLPPVIPETSEVNYLDRAFGLLRLLSGYYDLPLSPAPCFEPTVATGPATYRCREMRRSDFAPLLDYFSWIKDDFSPTQSTEAMGYILNMESNMESACREPGCPWPHELGAGNASMGPATSLKIINTLYPDIPTVEKSNARALYADQVWSDWWSNRDVYENSYNYNGLWLTSLNAWLDDLTEDERQAIFTDAQFKTFARRFLEQTSPLGSLSGYGDGNGFGSRRGYWMAIFERFAAAYKPSDPQLAGEFKWAAHQIFRWLTGEFNPLNDDSFNNVKRPAIVDMMTAWRYADDSIDEVVPSDIASVVHYRHAVTFPSTEDRILTGYPAMVWPQIVPDKLTLRSGWGATDTFASVELAQPMGHGHYDTGSVNLLTSHGSVLLSDTAYATRNQRFHNMFQLIPQSGPDFSNNESVMEKNNFASVPIMQNGQSGTYAQVTIDHYLGPSDVKLDRRFFQVKPTASATLGDFIWVLDSVSGQGESFAVGPAWQTMALNGAAGRHWADTRFPMIPNVNTGYPQGYLTQWPNAPWNLLVAFGSDEGDLQIDDVTHDDTAGVGALSGQKFRVWNKKVVTLAPDRPAQFNSFLAPHSPSVNPAPLAAGFAVMPTDFSSATVIKRQQVGASESLWLGVNDTGTKLTVGPIITDAKWFLIKMDGDQLEKYWLGDVTSFDFFNQTIVNQSDRMTIDSEEVPAGLTVNSGGDKSVVFPQEVALDGVVVSLPSVNPNLMTIAWSQVSGPGEAVFNNPQVAATRAKFSTPGIYVLQLSADNGVHRSFASATIIVLSAPVPPSDSANDFMTFKNVLNPLKDSSIGIAFVLAQNGEGSLIIYSREGKKIKTLVEGSIASGPHTVAWDGRNEGGEVVASGIYNAVLSFHGGLKKRKIAVIK